MTVSAPRESDRSAGRSVPDTVAQLRATFRSGRTRPLEWRIGQLEALVRLMTWLSRYAAKARGFRLTAWLAIQARASATIDLIRRPSGNSRSTMAWVP